MQALVYDVLQPLRMLDAAAVADAVEVALMEASAATFTPLMHAVSKRDNAFVERVAELADDHAALPERVGLPLKWAEQLSTLDAATDAARRMPSCVTARRKIETFVDVCEEVSRASNGTLNADELIPVCAYILVTARLDQLPSDLCLIKLFITNEKELLGRIGYGLATLEAVTSFIGPPSPLPPSPALAATLCPLPPPRAPPSPPPVLTRPFLSFAQVSARCSTTTSRRRRPRRWARLRGWRRSSRSPASPLSAP